MTGSALPLAAFAGLDPLTGRAVAGDAHLAASIRDILTTPVGSRVMRRDYGSALFALTGRPLGPTLVAEIVAATAEAIEAHEPRVDVARVDVRAAGPDGRLAVDVHVRLDPVRILVVEVIP